MSLHWKSLFFSHFFSPNSSF